MNDEAANRQVHGLSTLLQLEKDARAAGSLRQLAFVMANDSHRLLRYRQGILWRRRRGGRIEIMAISGVSQLDHASPYLRWLRRMIAAVLRGPSGREPHDFDAGALSSEDREGWAEWLAPHALWLPLRSRRAQVLGGLVFAREAPWQEHDHVLAAAAGDAYQHAWTALEPGGPPQVADLLRLRTLWLLLAAAGGACLFLPVQQSVLAPAQVAPVDPIVVSAPVDAVVESFQVAPNEDIAAGDPLFRFDDTAVRNQVAVAGRALEVAEAELARAGKLAFRDPQAKGDLPVLEARVRQRRAERDHARELMQRYRVVAAADGVAVFDDANDWIGRPARIGERVMLIADPGRTEIRMDLAVENALQFPPSARVQVFLNVDPLNPLEAELRYVSYEATPSEANVLSYRVRADLVPGQTPPRIGLKGTAKLYGEQVNLFMFLFRRPLGALRRWLG